VLTNQSTDKQPDIRLCKVGAGYPWQGSANHLWLCSLDAAVCCRCQSR
jgi:hypothetical protein